MKCKNCGSEKVTKSACKVCMKAYDKVKYLKRKKALSTCEIDLSQLKVKWR